MVRQVLVEILSKRKVSPFVMLVIQIWIRRWGINCEMVFCSVVVSFLVHFSLIIFLWVVSGLDKSISYTS